MSDSLLPNKAFEQPIFEPNLVLPGQYNARSSAGSEVAGEKRLVAAILQDAISCYMKEFPTSRRSPSKSFLEAEWWIFSGDQTGVFCYDTVCGVLGIDPDYVRQGLERWVERTVGVRRGADADYAARAA